MGKIIATLKQRLTPQGGAKDVLLKLADLGYMVLGAVLFYHALKLAYHWGTLAR